MLPADFKPSRKRTLECVTKQAAAGNQPSGAALPSLLPGEPSNPTEHLNAALKTDPFSILLEQALSADEKRTISNCATAPDQVISRRFAAKAFLADAARKLEPQRTSWASQLPENSPARNLNFPLMFWVANTLEFEDKDLVGDLFNGMPIAGPIKPVPTLTERPTIASVTLEQWRDEIPERNKINTERVKKSQGSAAANACFEKTMKEVEAGWVSVPIPLSQADPLWPLTPRYALEEQHGTQAKKIRLIDDFRASGLNNTVTVNDTNIPDGLDSFIATCSAYQRMLEGRTLLACSVDFAHAYKHVPLLQAHEDFAKIIFAQPKGEPLVASLRTQPFGSKKSPGELG